MTGQEDNDTDTERDKSARKPRPSEDEDDWSPGTDDSLDSADVDPAADGDSFISSGTGSGSGDEEYSEESTDDTVREDRRLLRENVRRSHRRSGRDKKKKHKDKDKNKDKEQARKKKEEREVDPGFPEKLDTALFEEPDFAVISSFVSHFGDEQWLPPEIGSPHLAHMINDEGALHPKLKDLLIRLLRRAIKSFRPQKWERYLVKFCASNGRQRTAWELERFGFEKAHRRVKLAAIKALFEYQFVCNAKFKATINQMEADELRLRPVGKDVRGRCYWFQMDRRANLALYREDQDEETLKLIARDREGVRNIIAALKSGKDPIVESVLEEDSNSSEDDPSAFDGSGTISEKEEEPPDASDVEEAPRERIRLRIKKTVCEPTDVAPPSKKKKGKRNRGGRNDEDEVIEEKVMIVEGEGNGADCEAVPEVPYGDEICEDVMYVYGEGSGADCCTGNPSLPSATTEERSGPTESSSSGECVTEGSVSGKGASPCENERSNAVNGAETLNELDSPVKDESVVGDSQIDAKSVSSAPLPVTKRFLQNIPKDGLQVDDVQSSKTAESCESLGSVQIALPDKTDSTVSSVPTDGVECDKGITETDIVSDVECAANDEDNNVDAQNIEATGESEVSPAIREPKFFFGQPGCLKLSPSCSKSGSSSDEFKLVINKNSNKPDDDGIESEEKPVEIESLSSEKSVERLSSDESILTDKPNISANEEKLNTISEVNENDVKISETNGASCDVSDSVERVGTPVTQSVESKTDIETNVDEIEKDSIVESDHNPVVQTSDPKIDIEANEEKSEKNSIVESEHSPVAQISESNVNIEANPEKIEKDSIVDVRDQKQLDKLDLRNEIEEKEKVDTPKDLEVEKEIKQCEDLSNKNDIEKSDSINKEEPESIANQEKLDCKTLIEDSKISSNTDNTPAKDGPSDDSVDVVEDAEKSEISSEIEKQSSNTNETQESSSSATVLDEVKTETQGKDLDSSISNAPAPSEITLQESEPSKAEETSNAPLISTNGVVSDSLGLGNKVDEPAEATIEIKESEKNTEEEISHSNEKSHETEDKTDASKDENEINRSEVDVDKSVPEDSALIDNIEKSPRDSKEDANSSESSENIQKIKPATVDDCKNEIETADLKESTDETGNQILSQKTVDSVNEKSSSDLASITNSSEALTNSSKILNESQDLNNRNDVENLNNCDTPSSPISKLPSSEVKSNGKHKSESEVSTDKTDLNVAEVSDICVTKKPKLSIQAKESNENSTSKESDSPPTKGRRGRRKKGSNTAESETLEDEQESNNSLELKKKKMKSDEDVSKSKKLNIQNVTLSINEELDQEKINIIAEMSTRVCNVVVSKPTIDIAEQKLNENSESATSEKPSPSKNKKAKNLETVDVRPTRNTRSRPVEQPVEEKVSNDEVKSATPDKNLKNRKRVREETKSQSEEETVEPQTGKKFKSKTKVIKSAMRKKVELSKQTVVTSDDEQEPEQTKGKRKYQKKSAKAEQNVEKSETEKVEEEPKTTAGKKKKKPESTPAPILDDPPVRQSRRIAQLKIKEEAERRLLEEIALRELKEKHKKSLKMKKKKDEDWHQSDSDHSSDVPLIKEKKIKDKKLQEKWKKNPTVWHDTSGSSEANTEGEEDIDDHDIEEEEELVFKSDHEFSPESDVEDQEYKPTRRARTLQKDDDGGCTSCKKKDHPEWILLCDSCDAGWHASCLKPILFLIPEGEWFCPPCSHKHLIENLESKLLEHQSLSEQVKIEDEKRLELAEKQLKNKVSSDTESDKSESKSNDESGRNSSSSGSSSSTDSENEKIYRLRERKQLPISYHFKEYDQLMSSAIKEEYKDSDENPTGNQGRGKDISTIIEASREEKRAQLQAALEAKTASGENADQETLAELIESSKRVSIKSRRKPRKLNSLDVLSDDCEDNSDEDFKDTESSTSDESASESEQGKSSHSSDSLPLRRSESAHKKSKKKKSNPEEPKIKSDSEEPEKPAVENEPEKNEDDNENDNKNDTQENESKEDTNKTSSKDSKKKKSDAEGEGEEKVEEKPKPPPMRAKIKYGGLSDDSKSSHDWSPAHRTRQRKYNYMELPNTDSEDEAQKPSGKHMYSSDEFKLSGSDSETSMKKKKKSKKSIDPDKEPGTENAEGKPEGATPKAKAGRGRGVRGRPKGSRNKAGTGRGRARLDEPPIVIDPATMTPAQIEKEKKRQERIAKLQEKEKRKEERLKKKEEKIQQKEQKAKEREEKKQARMSVKDQKSPYAPGFMPQPGMQLQFAPGVHPRGVGPPNMMTPQYPMDPMRYQNPMRHPNDPNMYDYSNHRQSEIIQHLRSQEIPGEGKRDIHSPERRGIPYNPMNVGNYPPNHMRPPFPGDQSQMFSSMRPHGSPYPENHMQNMHNRPLNPGYVLDSRGMPMKIPGGDYQRAAVSKREDSPTMPQQSEAQNLMSRTPGSTSQLDSSDSMSSNEGSVNVPSKRRGRGLGKKTLAKQAAAAAAAAASGSNSDLERSSSTPNNPSLLPEGTLAVAGAPQPFRPNCDPPSVITRMPHMMPPPYRNSSIYGNPALYGPPRGPPSGHIPVGGMYRPHHPHPLDPSPSGGGPIPMTGSPGRNSPHAQHYPPYPTSPYYPATSSPHGNIYPSPHGRYPVSAPMQPRSPVSKPQSESAESDEKSNPSEKLSSTPPIKPEIKEEPVTVKQSMSPAGSDEKSPKNDDQEASTGEENSQGSSRPSSPSKQMHPQLKHAESRKRIALTTASRYPQGPYAPQYGPYSSYPPTSESPYAQHGIPAHVQSPHPIIRPLYPHSTSPHGPNIPQNSSPLHSSPHHPSLAPPVHRLSHHHPLQMSPLPLHHQGVSRQLSPLQLLSQQVPPHSSPGHSSASSPRPSVPLGHHFPPHPSRMQHLPPHALRHPGPHHFDPSQPQRGSEEPGEFGGLVSYFSSQRDDEIDS